MGQIKMLFNGRVKIETLPSIISPVGQKTEGPARLLLEKGEMAKIYDGDGPIKYIAYIELIPGKTRGGHYHDHQEYFYIIRGEMEFEFADVDIKVNERAVVKEGDLISIDSKVAHRIKTIKAGHAIEFLKSRFKLEDVIAYPFNS